MYRLFVKPPSAHYTGIYTPQMDRLRGLVNDHFDYQLYLNDVGGFIVPSDHLLVKLALNLLSYIESNVNTFQVISNHLQQICSINKLTSILSFGSVFENFIYTEYSAIFAINEATVFDCEKWEEYASIKVIEHPLTDMDIFMPTVMEKDQVQGFSVFTIDLPMMAYQLKQWLKNNKNNQVEKAENISYFFSQFLLPKLIPSYLDIALRNRIPSINLDAPIGHQRRERSWAKSYEDSFGRTIKNTLDILNTSKLPFFRTLESIPLVYEKSFYSALPFEIGTLSSYSYWLMFYVFTQYFNNIIDLVDVQQTENTDLRKNIVRVNRLLANGYLVTRHMPNELKIKLFQQYSKIQDKYL